MKLFILILLISTQGFANECKSLFLDSKLSDHSIDQVIAELHDLKVKSYDLNPNTARVANSLFNEKLKELERYLTVKEIKLRLRNGLPTNKNPNAEAYEQMLQGSRDLTDDVLIMDFIRELGLRNENLETKYGEYILYHAVRYKRNYLIEPIFRSGFDINSHNGQALQLASLTGNIEAVNILLANGASVNLMRGKRTALSEATSNGHIGIATKLLKNGADPNLVVSYPADADTSLYHAGKLGRHDLIDLLLESGASKYIEGHSSAIHGAVQGNKLETVEYLLSRDFDINAKDSFGNTPLYDVQSVEMAQYLLENGADPKIRNTKNDTADEYLANINYPHDIISVIKERRSIVYRTYLKAKSGLFNYLNNKDKAK